MYSLNRQQAADILGISTRSIDRYIKSGKIRAKKEGKIVLLNENDVKILSGDTQSKQKIIIDSNIEDKIISKKEDNKESSGIVKKEEYNKILATFDKMFVSFREEIKQKDEKIQELSLELGKVLEQKNNSIDLMEYKKAQFLNEETKKSLLNSLEKEKQEKENLNNKLRYEKNTNKLLIIFLIILFLISGIVFFLNI